MEGNYTFTSCNGHTENPDLQIIRYSPFQFPPSCNNFSSPWFDLRVFYVRISNFLVDDSTPEFLNLKQIALDPETLLEVNGVRDDATSDGASSIVRRDRFDRKSEEATYVCTDSIRTTGSVKFEVFHKEDLILSGALELPRPNGYESKGNNNKWRMNCEPLITTGSGFLRGKPNGCPATIDVYVTGSFAGAPVILTKTMHVCHRKKQNRRAGLHAIPEDDTREPVNDGQLVGDESEKVENEEEYEDQLYWRRMEEMDGEDGELSWFNAGVRVGVGIGLGICVGIGLGVGLLVRSYQATSRTIKRRLL